MLRFILTPIKQGGTQAEPISAIPAAIAEDTSLLLGIWASAGPDIVNNEITALKAAIEQYGDAFTKLVVGISVGSEDLYRDSNPEVHKVSGPGVAADTLVSYINQVKDAIAGTPLSNVPIGHVDTWTAWVNGSNKAVIDAVDWLGVDAYPYFEKERENSVQNGKSLFYSALQKTKDVAGGKEIWVTETGWPVSGKTENLGVPSPENAKIYWDEVGCSLFGKVHTWWYTLQDAKPVTPDPAFGIIGSELTTTPLFDLTCPEEGESSSAVPAPTSGAPGSSTAATETQTSGGVGGSQTLSPSAPFPSSNATGPAATGVIPTSRPGQPGPIPTGQAPGGGAGGAGDQTTVVEGGVAAPTTGGKEPAFTGKASTMSTPSGSVFGTIVALAALVYLF